MRYLNHSDLRTWGLLNREVSVAPIAPPVVQDTQQAPYTPGLAAYLKVDVSLLAPDANASAGYRKFLDGKFKVSELRFLHNAELTGHILAELRPIQYADCVMRCEGDVRCAAFNYQNRRCTLLSTATSLARTSGSVAGLRR